METLVVFDKLRTLQDILSERIVLEREIQAEPLALGTKEDALAKVKRSFIERNQEYEQTKAREKEFRILLQQAEETREKAEKNMDVISTQREYEALEKEIKDAGTKEQNYRKDLLVQERRISELDEEMKRLTALIKQQEDELAEDQAGIEAKIAEKQTVLTALQEQEQRLTADLDTELVSKFERIIKNKGNGIVAIKNGVCMGCRMILPAQFANQIRMGKEIVFCPYCSRILFYEEAEGADEEYFAAEDAGALADLDDLDDEDYDEDYDEDKGAADFEE